MPKWICKRCDYERQDEPKENWDTCPNCDGFVWMREGERNNLKWTTEPPTEPGFYWVKNRKLQVFSEKEVEVLFFDGTHFSIAHGEYFAQPVFFAQFLGPLPEPPQ